ncbi:hypothetical protein IEO21_00291 [Rhodonia placenta]|uniref:Copper transport protein n=1 Tax=Rhodonia placenta TaxID=104341 RepID=A0A8H7U6A0_9APHY|nr:hypothetical protein IEO21_00291 [Postia placenta]
MSSMDMMMMTPYLHFTGGDNLLFKTLMPSSHGAIAGACLVLIAIAIFERWVAATRGILTDHWRRRILLTTIIRAFSILAGCHPANDSQASSPSLENKDNGLDIEERPIRTVEPFMLSHDLPRGVLYALQALLAYLLMLSVMTFQAAYIIAIVLGLGLGEVLFGRLGGRDNHLLH